MKTPIISRLNRTENFSKLRFRNLRISKCFRSTSLCFPWAGRRAPDYAVPTSRLLCDPSLVHRQAMSDSRKRRGSAALPLYMRYARPHHNPADQGSLVKAISAAVVLAAAFPCSKGHPHRCNIGSTYRPWRREFCGYDAFTAVRIYIAVVVQQ